MAVTDRPGKWWMVNIDTAALRSGFGICVVFAVPFQVLAQLVGRSSGWSLPLRLLSLAGFLLGAGVAAWAQQRELPLAHGLVTAIVSFAVVQTAFVVARAIAGHDTRIGAAFANLAPVFGVGLLGGYLGMAMRHTGMVPSGERGRADRSDHDEERL
jgi:predicted amidohydrolase